MKISNDAIRDAVRKFFKEKHPNYKPTFFKQGSSKTKNRIRTKEDTCDQDDGVYFESNPDNVTCTTLQGWVKEAVEGITDATPQHRKKCITVDFKAGYSIDLPVFIYDKNKQEHPLLAVKDSEFQEDDPKEFIEEFNRVKDSGGQMIRTSRYLKSWCDYKREKMPSGLAMTVLTMNHLQKNQRDDVALKFTLIEIEKELKREFKCMMPTTPKDNLFKDFDEIKKKNFMNNLSEFIKDAKEAVDNEKNLLKASRCWQKHFGKTYFPDGADENEASSSPTYLSGTIGNAKPYCETC